MLNVLLAVKVATTQADLVRYAADKGVKVATANPTAVVTPEKEKAIKAWIDGTGRDHHDKPHGHGHTHHSQTDPR